MNRRGFLSLLAVPSAIPAAAAEASTATVRHPVPECLCGSQMVVLPMGLLPYEFPNRDARRMVCINPRCELYGKVCLETLYEVLVTGDRWPHERSSLPGSAARYVQANYSLRTEEQTGDNTQVLWDEFIQGFRFTKGTRQ